jgi:hypothetical protein
MTMSSSVVDTGRMMSGVRVVGLSDLVSRLFYSLDAELGRPRPVSAGSSFVIPRA